MGCNHLFTAEQTTTLEYVPDGEPSPFVRCRRCGENWFDDLRTENAALTRALAERRGREEALRIALLAKMKMEGRGNLHAKLDDALSWTENDELAEKLAQAALAAATPPQGGV